MYNNVKYNIIFIKMADPERGGGLYRGGDDALRGPPATGTHLSIYLSIYYIYLSIYPERGGGLHRGGVVALRGPPATGTQLSTYLSIHPSIYLSICLS